LTYYGFHALQLVDATGAHPFDRNRRGMSVGEGAALLYLTAAEIPPENTIAELLGFGLSCDAHHPAAPHPEGAGALRAMKSALSDARISPVDIDYIHLHGTGTIDNDLAEAKAVNALFGEGVIPPLSSMKGSIGHSLAAAGAIGAVVSALSISHNIIPANTGFYDLDPALNLILTGESTAADVNVVLANSFGFGGNNAVLALGHPKRKKDEEMPVRAIRPVPFTVLGRACITGAGNENRIIERMECGGKIAGIISSSDLLGPLCEKSVRRLKRLPRMVMSLSVSACMEEGKAGHPASVFFGTGWGGLSETHDFLKGLFASDERFASPTDFIGSVHNAAAGHVAIHFNAVGPNVTTTGGDHAFEEALMTASLLTRHGDDPILVIGADEYHDTLSPLLDASVALAGEPSEGGGALYLKPATSESPCRIHPSFMAYSAHNEQIVPDLVHELGGATRIRDQFGAILAGIPAAQREEGQRQLRSFLSVTAYLYPVYEYRRFVGEFASASAVAAVLATLWVQSGEIPENVCRRRPLSLGGRGILLLGFGRFVTAVEIIP
jgi:3-oxoacyl-[acyl-carrier-protein] synthase-1/3-oxoacyl-[acyl-carrier-protein] synthase II